MGYIKRIGKIHVFFERKYNKKRKGFIFYSKIMSYTICKERCYRTLTDFGFENLLLYIEYTIFSLSVDLSMVI